MDLRRVPPLLDFRFRRLQSSASNAAVLLLLDLRRLLRGCRSAPADISPPENIVEGKQKQLPIFRIRSLHRHITRKEQ